MMTELELITTALAAGAGAGIKDTTSSVVKDAYAGLKGLLTHRLVSREKAAQVLQAEEAQAEVWQARLGDDLVAAGATTDEEVLAAARRVLALVDPVGDRAGVYTVSVSTNYGAAGTFNAPITINNATPPAPGP
jgi:hypothetical protein